MYFLAAYAFFACMSMSFMLGVNRAEDKSYKTWKHFFEDMLFIGFIGLIWPFFFLVFCVYEYQQHSYWLMLTKELRSKPSV